MMVKPRLASAKIAWCNQDADNEGWLVTLYFADFSQECHGIEGDVPRDQSKLEFMESQLIAVLASHGLDVRHDEIDLEDIDGGVCHYMHPEEDLTWSEIRREIADKLDGEHVEQWANLDRTDLDDLLFRAQIYGIDHLVAEFSGGDA
jgi:hypothetical protein